MIQPINQSYSELAHLVQACSRSVHLTLHHARTCYSGWHFIADDSSLALRWDQRFRISFKLPGDAVDSQTALKETRFWLPVLNSNCFVESPRSSRAYLYSVSDTIGLGWGPDMIYICIYVCVHIF